MKKLTTLLTALAVISFIGTAFAQLDIGGDIKVLGVWTDNVTDADDDWDDQQAFLRTEMHLWFQADLSENVTTKVSVEADRPWNQDDVEGEQELDVFLEEAWIQMMYLWDSAFSVKLGRQFIEFGDGFIVGDSDPFSEFSLNDKGEWEVDPFDAILAWYDGDDWILNLMGAKVSENRLVNNKDIDVYGAYFSYSGAEEIVFDVYGFMAKIKDNYMDLTSNADVYWVGARIAGTMVEGLSYKLEGTYQFGDINDSAQYDDIKAWAVEAGAKYMIDAEYNPWLGLTYVFLLSLIHI